jgi:hypothetical protein
MLIIMPESSEKRFKSLRRPANAGPSNAEWLDGFASLAMTPAEPAVASSAPKPKLAAVVRLADFARLGFSYSHNQKTIL